MTSLFSELVDLVNFIYYLANTFSSWLKIEHAVKSLKWMKESNLLGIIKLIFIATDSINNNGAIKFKPNNIDFQQYEDHYNYPFLLK